MNPASSSPTPNYEICVRQRMLAIAGSVATANGQVSQAGSATHSPDGATASRLHQELHRERLHLEPPEEIHDLDVVGNPRVG